MADLVEVLHDELDALEDLRERADAVVTEVIEQFMAELLATTGDPAASLGLIAAEVDRRLADLTTEAFKRGVDFAYKRTSAE